MSDFAKDINVPTNDLISRQDAIDALKKVLVSEELGYAIPVLEDLPSAQPTIDAVEVVRCTECRLADWYTTKMGKFCHCLETEKRGLTETDYCSFGEKMDGERRDNA